MSDRPVVPVSATVGGPPYDVDAIMAYLRARVHNLVVVDANKAADELGSTKCLNVVLLGAATRSGALSLTPDDIESAIRQLVRPHFLDLNLRALNWR